MSRMKSYSQIGEELGLSETYVCAIARRALDKLRAEVHDRAEIVQLVTGTITTAEDYLSSPEVRDTYEQIMSIDLEELEELEALEKAASASLNA